MFYYNVTFLGEFYLAHTSPEDVKGKTIADSVTDIIRDTPLDSNLTLVGYDSTASMTGVNKGAIRNIELTLGRALQWAICLLHLNELPLRHLFIELDGPQRAQMNSLVL